MDGRSTLLWIPKQKQQERAKLPRKHRTRTGRGKQRDTKARTREEIKADPTTTDETGVQQEKVRKDCGVMLIEEEWWQVQMLTNKERLLEKDSFLAHPLKPAVIKAQRVVGDMSEIQYCNRISSLTCHHTCTSPNPKPEVKSLLGLGFIFACRNQFQIWMWRRQWNAFGTTYAESIF